MKWIIGITVVFLAVYFGAGPVYRAMKKHDYDGMFNGIQDAKRRAGGTANYDKSKFISYSEKYAKGYE